MVSSNIESHGEQRREGWQLGPGVSLSAQSRLCLNVLVASRMRRPETADSWAAQLSADDPETAPGAESPADGAAEARCERCHRRGPRLKNRLEQQQQQLGGENL